MPTSGATEASTPPARTLISGIITGPDGAPVVDAAVTVSSESVPMPQMAVFTDSQGSFTWLIPQPGDYTVTVIRDGFADATAEVTVAAGVTATLELQLEPR
jgi:hypothetical protein